MNYASRGVNFFLAETTFAFSPPLRSCLGETLQSLVAPFTMSCVLSRLHYDFNEHDTLEPLCCNNRTIVGWITFSSFFPTLLCNLGTGNRRRLWLFFFFFFFPRREQGIVTPVPSLGNGLRHKETVHIYIGALEQFSVADRSRDLVGHMDMIPENTFTSSEVRSYGGA